MQQKIHINYAKCDRLTNSIKPLKGKILESIALGEFHHVKYFDLRKKRHIQKFDKLISKNKITQSATNVTDKKWVTMWLPEN